MTYHHLGMLYDSSLSRHFIQNIAIGTFVSNRVSTNDKPVNIWRTPRWFNGAVCGTYNCLTSSESSHDRVSSCSPVSNSPGNGGNGSRAASGCGEARLSLCR